MEAIFHEKQEGSLCAQHCLNSLLQGPYFTPVDLSTIAQKLDDEERQRMAECGEESEEYRRFLEQPSGNMDDSGYFSVQVISCALQVWGLELVPLTSTDERVKGVLTDPSSMKAFICNYKDHWFTIRKIGNYWFNLNSLLAKPQLISDTYLSLFLAQLRNEGYSIFVVFGEFPESTADEVFRNNPVLRPQPRLTTQSSETDIALQEALERSLGDSNSLNFTECEDPELQQAMRLSLEGDNLNSAAIDNEDDEEALLKRAIDMSLQC